MKLYLKTPAIVLLIFIIFSMTSCASKEKDVIETIKSNGYITMATNAEFEPFEFKAENKIVGIDIDISKEIANDLGVDLKVNDISFDAVIFELKEKKSDFAAAALSYDEDRAKNVDFSNPYFNASQSIIVMKNSNISNADDLKGKNIGVHLGTTGDTYCTQAGSMQVVRFNKSMDAVSDMINGQIDAVVVDDFTANKLVEKNNAVVKKLDQALTKEEYRIAVTKGNTELLNIINKTISKLEESGKLDEIIEKYMYSENSYKSDEAITKEQENNSGGFIDQIYLNLIEKDRYKYIISGLIETLKITIFAVVIGTAIGLMIAILKVLSAENKKFKPLGILANIYLTVIRGTPTVVQLFIMYYIILATYPTSKSFAAILAFGINSGAYVAEIIRAGIMSVDKGQTEAGRSLGLNQRTTYVKIIFPQALKNILPALANEMITLIKETSVAGFIGVVDLSKAGDIIRSQTYESVVPFLTIAIIYLISVVGLTSILIRVEKGLRKSDIR